MVVVCEHPGPWESFHREPLKGDAAQQAVQVFRDNGITEYSAIFRIACYPNTQAKRTDSVLAKAAKCCQARFEAGMRKIDPRRNKEIIMLGKHASSGWLGSYDWELTSGATSRIPIEKLCREIPFQRYLKLDHPRVPFWYKTPSQVTWKAAIKRFAETQLQGHNWGKPPKPFLHANEETLQIIESLGPSVGWDVETLGKDPLTAPITCIGLSDGERTVSIPWDPYDTARQGRVKGIDEYGYTGKLIRKAVLTVLKSNRTLVTQNGSYDVMAMESKGLPGRNDFDLMHAYKTLWPEIPGNLEAIGVHLVKSLDHRWKSVFRSGRDDDAKGSDVFKESSELDLRHYNAMDAWVTAAARAPLDEELDKED